MWKVYGMESVNFRIKNKVLYVLSSELIKSCNISSMDRINSYKENVPNCEITQNYINYYTMYRCQHYNHCQLS